MSIAEYEIMYYQLQMAVAGSQDSAIGAWVWLRPQLSDMLTLNWLKASRAGSVNNHNLRVADRSPIWLDSVPALFSSA